jgi:transcription antitermination factor NusG
MTAHQYWTACQTIGGREHVVRAEIEKANRPAFLPTFVRMWAADGKLSAREYAAVPGYVFFLTNSEDWPPIRAIEGVSQVLTADGKAKRIADDEMKRIVLQHACGDLNRIEVRITTAGKVKGRTRHRRPRPGKRIRKSIV